MAAISIRPNFPNILILSGIDVYNASPMVGRAMTTLDAASGQPVHKGTHEFWVLHPMPGFSQASNFQGHTDSGSPHARRGVISMNATPVSLTSMNIAGYLSTLLQEIGHHWLSPGDMKIRISGTDVAMATSSQLTQWINDDVPFRRVPLIGRSGSHWTPYWKSDDSPMDGLCFQTIGQSDGLEFWRETQLCQKALSLGDGTAPDVVGRGFSDLDLYIMNLKSADEAYSGGKGIVWMQPRITEFAESRTGVTVVFARDDQLLFGFDQGDTTLSVRDSSGTLLGGSAVIQPDYHPYGKAMNGMMLRIIRRGTRYFFQAKISKPPSGLLGFIYDTLNLPAAMPGVWNDMGDPGPAIPRHGFDRWRTVSIVEHSGEPVGVGSFVNKWKLPHLCDAAFYRFELLQGSKRWSIRTNKVPDIMAKGQFSTLTPGRILREENEDAIVRTTIRRLHLIAPFIESGSRPKIGDETFLHGKKEDKFLDNSLKALTKAPEGDFAFATHAKLHRSIVTPWAGGYAANKELRGRPGRASAADVRLSSASKARQDHPDGNVYRMAFIAVTADANSLTDGDLTRLDTLRRYAEVAFAAATENRASADTSL